MFLVSGNIIENSVIFPKSAVAFLIISIRDIGSQNDRFALDEKIVERYSNSFLSSLTRFVDLQPSIYRKVESNKCTKVKSNVFHCRVTKFGQIHRNCFVLTTSPLIEEDDLAMLSTLQER